MFLCKEAACKKSCKIGPCCRCSSHHNILLCGKDLSEEEVRAFYAEEEDDRDDGEEDERYRESLQNESVFISSLMDSITKQKGKEGTSGGDAKEKKEKDAEFAFLQCMQVNPVNDETAVSEDSAGLLYSSGSFKHYLCWERHLQQRVFSGAVLVR